jgi:hypothetical protein
VADERRKQAIARVLTRKDKICRDGVVLLQCFFVLKFVMALSNFNVRLIKIKTFPAALLSNQLILHL